MDRVVLGESGLSVSPVCFGTWQLSPRFWGEQSKDDAVAAMKLAFDQGKVRAIGVSNHSVEQLRAQRRLGPYSVIQPPYSLIDPVGETGLLPYCQAEDVGVMVYSPLHKGLLTGKYTGTETFDDFRGYHADFQGERFKELCDKVQSLQSIADRYGLTICQLAIVATLMHPAIHVAICGIKTPDQIAEAAGAVGKMISREDYFAVRNLVGPAGPKLADAKGEQK